MRVLVTGGTGVIGKPCVDRLVERGHSVRLLSRDAEADAGQWAERIEAVTGSITDAGTVRGAAEGCDAILHIAGTAREDPPELTFQAMNVDGTRRLLEEGERAGVPRFLFISSLGADRGSSDYHASKRAAEALVRDYRGGWLILRPGAVYGPGDGVISTLLTMVRTLPAVPTVGGGDQPFQPIWAEDLAECLVRALEADEPAREALEVAGAEVTTTVDLLQRMAEVTGKAPLRVPVPAGVVRVGLELMSALGSEPPIDSAMLTLLAEENVITPGRPNALTEIFGVTPTPLATGLEKLAASLPEQLPDEGSGDLVRHRYFAEIEESALDADALFEMVRREFGSLTPDGLLQVDAEGRGESTLDPGAVLTMEIPLRGIIQVRVEEVKDRTATAVTLQGHPLTGFIRFLVRDVGGERAGGRLCFEVRSYFRSAGIVDRVAMATLGAPLQRATWTAMVAEVVRRSGGRQVGEIRAESGPLDEAEAARVERWAEELVRRRQREEG